jgi:hypothetical protein
MFDYNVLEISRRDYDTKEDFANAVRDAVMVLLNNHYIMTVEDDGEVVVITYNYADSKYGCDYPYWLSPDEYASVEEDEEENE